MVGRTLLYEPSPFEEWKFRKDTEMRLKKKLLSKVEEDYKVELLKVKMEELAE